MKQLSGGWRVGGMPQGRMSPINKYGCNGKGKGHGDGKDEYSDSGEVKQTRTK